MSEVFEFSMEPGQKSLKLLTAHKYLEKDIVINFPFTIITPKIGFDKGEFYTPNNVNGNFNIISSSDYNITFSFQGVSGCEELLFPINNLSPGATYTISFSETYNGDFINSEAYTLGCGIIQESTYKETVWPTGKGKPSYIQWSANGVKGTLSGTITFTAQTDTVYWAWALSDIKDSVVSTVSANVSLYVV